MPTCVFPLVRDGKRLGAGIGGFSFTPSNAGGAGASRVDRMFLGTYRGISLCKPLVVKELIREE